MVCLKKIGKYKYGLTAAAIIALGFFLHLHDLGTKPLWYSDEGSELNVDWNLIHGQLRYLELKFNFIPHLLLFYAFSSFFVILLGKTIFAIRLFASICIVASISIAYFTGKEMGGKKAGLLVVAVLFVFSSFFITARFAYLSSLDVLEISLVIFFSVKYLKTKNEKWIYYLSFALASAFLTEVYLWGMSIVLPLLLWPQKKKLLAKSLAIAFSPVALFFATMLVLGGKGFVDDIKYYYLIRIFSKSNFPVSPATRFAIILKSWVAACFWNFAGPIGLFFIPDKKTKRLFLALFLTIIIPVMSFISLSFLIRNQSLFMYLASFGSVFLILWSYSLIIKKFNLLGKFSRYAMLVAFLLIVLKSFQQEIYDNYNFFINYQKNEEFGLINATASFINENTTPDDYVIVSSDLFVHLLNPKVSNIYQATAYMGMGNSIYSPKYLYKERFYSDLSIEKAKFIIYDDDLKTFFSADEPNITKTFDSVIAKWPLAFMSGHYQIRQNPDFE
jgi:hypothetical protein